MNLGTILTILLLVFTTSIGVYILAWRASGRWYQKKAKSLAAMFRKAQWGLQEKHPDPLMRCWNYPGTTAHENKADKIAEEIDQELKNIYLAEQQRVQQQMGMRGLLGSSIHANLGGMMGQAHGRLTGLDQAGRSWWDDLFNRYK